MYAAAYNPNPKIIEALLANGANINARDRYGATPLMCAASDNKNPEVIESLIRHGADMNIKNNYGKTALDYKELQERVSEIFE